MFSLPDSNKFIEKFSRPDSCIYTRNGNLIVYKLNSESESAGSFPTESDYLDKYFWLDQPKNGWIHINHQDLSIVKKLSISFLNEAKYEIYINLWVSGSGFLHLDLPRFWYTDIQNTEPFLVTKIKCKSMKSRIELKSMRQTAANETEEIGNKCLKEHIRTHEKAIDDRYVRDQGF
jgi:hypothetical protein